VEHLAASDTKLRDKHQRWRARDYWLSAISAISAGSAGSTASSRAAFRLMSNLEDHPKRTNGDHPKVGTLIRDINPDARITFRQRFRWRSATPPGSSQRKSTYRDEGGHDSGIRPQPESKSVSDFRGRDGSQLASRPAQTSCCRIDGLRCAKECFAPARQQKTTSGNSQINWESARDLIDRSQRPASRPSPVSV
jgi:hypothetical protein